MIITIIFTHQSDFIVCYISEILQNVLCSVKSFLSPVPFNIYYLLYIFLAAMMFGMGGNEDISYVLNPLSWFIVIHLLGKCIITLWKKQWTCKSTVLVSSPKTVTEIFEICLINLSFSIFIYKMSVWMSLSFLALKNKCSA